MSSLFIFSRLTRLAVSAGKFKCAGIVFGLFILFFSSACYLFRTSRGGGQTDFHSARIADPVAVAVPAGYRVEVVATGLNFPTGIAFDDSGGLFVTEAGYAYGEVWEEAKLVRVTNGPAETVVSGGRNGPWNGVCFHEGYFYIAEGGVLEGGRILRVSPEGEVSILLDGLPSLGDHHTNGPVVGPDSDLYFGQGTATNSGVVGPDNKDFGWLDRYPEFHDIPGDEITLRGINFESGDLLSGERRKGVKTGPFGPFGKPVEEGDRRRGAAIASGSIVRLSLEGGRPEQVAWGFRNPFGLAFSPDGDLFVTDNGYDNRGSRPVWGAADFLWRVEESVWYGWPDFSGGRPLTDAWFRPPGEEPLEFLLKEHPNDPPAPIAKFGVHSSSTGLDFSRSQEFGYTGQAFVAQWGDLAPATNRLLAPVGFKVVRVDPGTGEVADFAVNRGRENGPASLIGGGGFERPVAARFSPDGRALYVVDFGVVTMEGKTPRPRPETGVVWRISREAPR